MVQFQPHQGNQNRTVQELIDELQKWYLHTKATLPTIGVIRKCRPSSKVERGTSPTY